MGSFSWLKADNLTKVANIAYGAPFKFLIPQEFGGGFIKDYYRDYGRIGEPDKNHSDTWGADEGKYDVYELLALWNYPEKCKYDGEFNPMKPIDKHTEHNRSLGINIGCMDNKVDQLKYPLKFVSASYKGSYEDCEGRSYNDPAQGSYPLTRKNLEGGHF